MTAWLLLKRPDRFYRQNVCEFHGIQYYLDTYFNICFRGRYIDVSIFLYGRFEFNRHIIIIIKASLQVSLPNNVMI